MIVDFRFMNEITDKYYTNTCLWEFVCLHIHICTYTNMYIPITIYIRISIVIFILRDVNVLTSRLTGALLNDKIN